MFFDDAKTASRILGITLTSRNKIDKNPVPLCGVPYHSAESYLSRLLDNGYKVAICEQVENPKFAKGVVKREVVKVLHQVQYLTLRNSTQNQIITLFAFAAIKIIAHSRTQIYQRESSGLLSLMILEILEMS